MKDSFDVVIVGSGAGGSPIANHLAQKGKSVLVIEKGPLLRPHYQAARQAQRLPARRDLFIGRREDPAHPGVANSGVSYYSSHVEPDLNDEPHVYRGMRRQRLRNHRRLHRAGRRWRHPALRRRLAALHARPTCS